jgi:VIT1/CCC1 family predicted Fe2+/Mn2+ transporter
MGLSLAQSGRPGAPQCKGVCCGTAASLEERAVVRRWPMASLLARFRAAVNDASSLRVWTFDTNDGIIATAGILEGFAGAGANDSILITAGVVAAISGGLGLGGARWSHESAEREAQLLLAAEEAEQLATSPEDKFLELAAHYEGRGVAPDLAA